MNGKKAKRLKGFAQTLTVGMPNASYVEGRPKVSVPIMSAAGVVVNYNTIPGIPTTLHPDCTRKVYKQLKRIK